jgi:hypothetical protein
MEIVVETIVEIAGTSWSELLLLELLQVVQVQHPGVATPGGRN